MCPNSGFVFLDMGIFPQIEEIHRLSGVESDIFNSFSLMNVVGNADL